MNGHVFLCHSPLHDGEYAARLATLLSGAGIPVAYDGGPSGILGERELQSRIENSAAVVVVMTPESEHLPRTGWELDLVARAHRPIVPLLLRGRPFGRLAQVPYEDATGGVLPSAAFLAHLQSLRALPAVPVTPAAPVARQRLTLALVAATVVVFLSCGLAGVALLKFAGGSDVAASSTAPSMPGDVTASPTVPSVPVLDEALRTKPVVVNGSGELAALTLTTIVRGTGVPIAVGQTITVNYVGVHYATGEEFDSSWGKEPFTSIIGVGNLIEGWDQGLIGVRVGSRVQLDIPADLAYGDGASAGQPAGDLRFVVDILSAS